MLGRREFRPQKTIDHGAELLQIFDLSEFAVSGEGDRAALFGNDDAQRIRQLRQTQGRGVARTDIAELRKILRKRQMGSEAGDAVLFHQDGAVVSR